jgi:hypothetical protein
MRTFDAEHQILRDMLDEGEIIAEKQHPDFKVSAIRHPTLGKVVIVQGRDGSGVIVETEE